MRRAISGFVIGVLRVAVVAARQKSWRLMLIFGSLAAQLRANDASAAHCRCAQNQVAHIN